MAEVYPLTLCCVSLNLPPRFISAVVRMLFLRLYNLRIFSNQGPSLPWKRLNLWRWLRRKLRFLVYSSWCWSWNLCKKILSHASELEGWLIWNIMTARSNASAVPLNRPTTAVFVRIVDLSLTISARNGRAVSACLVDGSFTGALFPLS